MGYLTRSRICINFIRSLWRLWLWFPNLLQKKINISICWSNLKSDFDSADKFPSAHTSQRHKSFDFRIHVRKTLKLILKIVISSEVSFMQRSRVICFNQPSYKLYKANNLQISIKYERGRNIEFVSKLFYEKQCIVDVQR